MPSTHLSLHYHIVFSTKERCAFIENAWRDRLHAFLGGAVRTLHGVPQIIGGTADHVHLLLGLRATHCLADVVRDVKEASSEWVHQTIRLPIFSWQEGYGAFTVSASMLDKVNKYVVRQEQHHAKKSYKDEYRELLVKSGVKYKEE